MEIIIASNNQNKIKEIKKMFNQDIKLYSLKDIGFDKEIEETGKTFSENALIKAKTIYDIYKIPVIADDSGLEVEALNFQPGVYSHRYASDLCDDKLNNEKLVKNMKDKVNKTANYTCALCYYDGDPIYAIGKCYGEIVLTPKGENGFGYDPYFYIPSLGKTMAELDLIEKNKISHRGKAILELKRKLYDVFNSGR